MFLDTFMFNGDWIVKLRLEYLFPYVDWFYIVESRYTFSGKRKETLFVETCAEWFEPYKSKIRIIVNEQMAHPNAWITEAYQRNFVLPHILNDMETREFTLAVCDCDEIYDLTTLPSKEDMLKNKTQISYLRMDLFYYRFSHQLQTERWCMAFLIHSAHLQDQPDLEKIRVNKQLKSEPVKATTIESGWHFSFFSRIEDIQRKIQSFSHTELNLPHITDLSEIRRRIREGLDVFGRINLNIKILDDEAIASRFPPLFLKYQTELLELQHDVA